MSSSVEPGRGSNFFDAIGAMDLEELVRTMEREEEPVRTSSSPRPPRMSIAKRLSSL
jgi:hypothetical protein